MVKKSKKQYIAELKKDSDRLYKLGGIMSVAGQFYRACLNWNDCSENAGVEDCYDICWQGWETVYQFQRDENELLGYYPELSPLQSFAASKPEDNIEDVSELKGKEWLEDWGLALELAGLFDKGREFCCSLTRIMKEPESKASIGEWKEWQQLGCVKKFYDSTFELSKKLYQTPLGIIAYCEVQRNPELRVLVLFCLLEEFRQLFIKFMTVSGPYYFNHGTFGFLGVIPEEKALGTLAMAPLGKIVHCEFKTRDDWKLDWDIITRGWAKYEQRLFDTWSYENGEYFGSNKVEDKAVWIMEPIMLNLFNKMASDIEKFALPLLVHDKYREEVESLLKINRNGLAKWFPGKIDWAYVKNLDNVIKSIERKGRLSELELLEKQQDIRKKTRPIKERIIRKKQKKAPTKTVDKRFTLRPGQVLFDNRDLNVGAGAAVEIATVLIKDFGHVVSFQTLDEKSDQTEASEKIRTAIGRIRKAVKSARIPVVIENRKAEGYVMLPSTK